VDNQWLGNRDALDWKQNKFGTATVSKYDYGVNSIGQRDSVAATSTVGTFATAPDWNWAYNGRGELVSSQHLSTVASSRHYTFDGIGNRNELRNGTHTTTGGTATAYTPNALNQYDDITVGTSSPLVPVYDLDGNMTSGPLPAVPGANSALVWDGENQLIEVTPSGGTAVQYHYDAFKRRIARTAGSTRTYWFYDGWNMVAEFSGAVHTIGTAPAVTLEKTWLWGTDLSGTLQGAGGVGGLLAAILETGATAGVYHPLYDGNGNIGQYINGSGTAVAKYEYDGFGNSLVSAGSHAALFPHRFSTKPLDSETGLYYYTYRYYDPVTGRWLSRDPIEERGGINLYWFVRNTPTGWVDLLGLAISIPPGGDLGDGNITGYDRVYPPIEMPDFPKFPPKIVEDVPYIPAIPSGKYICRKVRGADGSSQDKDCCLDAHCDYECTPLGDPDADPMSIEIPFKICGDDKKKVQYGSSGNHLDAFCPEEIEINISSTGNGGGWDTPDFPPGHPPIPNHPQLP